MPTAADFMKQLRKFDGAVTETVDPWMNPLRSSSPYFNSLYGESWGLPRGYSSLFWGAQKSGKSALVNDIIGQCHTNDPEALCVVYDAELRRTGQLTPPIAKAYGIDTQRLMLYQTNDPAAVWDGLRDNISDLCRQGAKIPIVAIDSITAVLGRQEAGSDSVMKQLRGDRATTTQLGLQRMLKFQREYGFHLILTAQARAEMDPNKAMRNDKKAAVSFGAFHHTEFFLYIERIESKKGNLDGLGRELRDDSKKDAMDSGDKTGHRVRVWMEASSMGPQDRTCEFTLDYKRGIINQEEEILDLASNWGVIKRPNSLTYEYNDKRWAGRPATLAAIRADVELQRSLIKDLMAKEKPPT